MLLLEHILCACGVIPGMYLELQYCNKQQLTIEVDTGASFSVISRKTYQKLLLSQSTNNNWQWKLTLECHFLLSPGKHIKSCFHQLLQQSNVKPKTYSDEPLPVHGSIRVEVCEGTQKLSLKLLVIGDSGPSLLGRDWMHCLRLNWNSIFHLQVHSLKQPPTKAFWCF